MTSTISHPTDKERPALVVGAAGQLGRMLMACWPAGADVVGTARQGAGDFIKLDLMLSADRTAEVMRGKGAVICMAGVIPAAVTGRGDVFSRNTDLALAAVRAAHAAGAGRVFLTSSAAVYGGTTGPLEETAALGPPSEYGRAKVEMEQASLALAAELDHPLTILRIGNVAGADAILGGWKTGMALDQLPDGGTPARSYIGPQTLARAVHALTQKEQLPSVLNLSAPGAVQMGALLDAAGLPWDPREASGSVIANVTLSTKLLETYVDFAPENGTPDGLIAEWRAFQMTSESPTS